MPPSTRRIEPVVKLDASDIKNIAAPMISSGWPARCSAWRPNGFAVPKSHALLMSVRKGPGISVLTRTVGPKARARPSVIALSPAFEAA